MIGWDFSLTESYEHESDVDFFSVLPNIERKRWLAEEVYRRSKIGVKTLTDQ